MKVSQLRGIINDLSSASDEVSGLNEALKRFDDMELATFSGLLKKVSATSLKRDQKTKSTAKNEMAIGGFSDISKKMKNLKCDAKKFDAEIEKLSKKRSFTKQDLQNLYKQVFETKSNLSLKLTKPEMAARFIRQRRRDANFASA